MGVKPVLCILALGLAISSAGLAQDESVPWAGSAIRDGENYSLDGDGERLQAPSSAIEFKDGKYYITIGSRISPSSANGNALPSCKGTFGPIL
jgi:hypothetical protein